MPCLLVVFEVGLVVDRFFDERFQTHKGVGFIPPRDVVHGDLFTNQEGTVQLVFETRLFKLVADAFVLRSSVKPSILLGPLLFFLLRLLFSKAIEVDDVGHGPLYLARELRIGKLPLGRGLVFDEGGDVALDEV